MDSIKQAVFLCGGIGSRLMPITKNVPKPMVLVNEKPFLFYLLKQLSDFGIKRFLLLTGYLFEVLTVLLFLHEVVAPQTHLPDQQF